MKMCFKKIISGHFIRKRNLKITNEFVFTAFTHLKKMLLFAAFVFIGHGAFSQNSRSQNTAADTVSKDMTISTLLDSMALDGSERSQSLYLNNKQIRIQNRIFNELETEIQNAKGIIKQGVDYVEITKEINQEIKLRELVMNGVIENDSNFLTVRNLVTTSILLKELLSRTEKNLKEIKESNSLIFNIQNTIDSIFAEKSNFIVPADSLQKTFYYQRYLQTEKNVKNIDTQLKNVLDSIQQLEILSKNLTFNLQADIAEITRLQKEKYQKIFTAKDEVFTDSETEKMTFAKSVIQSIAKGLLLLIFYFYNHWDSLIIILIFIVTISVYLKALKSKYVKAGFYKEIKYPVQILMHPIAASILISITFYQFFLPMPPFLLIGLIWIIAGIALTKIFYNTENKFVFRTWIVFFLLNILAIFDNIILIHTVAEARFILFLSVISFGFGLYIIFNRHQFDNKSKIWIIAGMIFLEFLSVIFLLTGNYNTGKVLMTEGIFTVIVGYLLINTFRLSRDIIVFSGYLKESDEVKKPGDLSTRPGRISLASFTFFLVGWIILITRNSYGFQRFIEPFTGVLSDTREIGEFTFTYEGIFVFFLVLVISGFISKIVSFLADDKRVGTAGSTSSGLGSWLLLIRIGIITTGIIIAFRSAGFPMDRLTMILSALGVGIGFGLNTLINNLVSGLILAFEKPVNLDDIVEIGGQTGKMKSIGIRSSVITTYDGSDVIIPNGDLLNQHLVNWTMGSSRRRYEIKVGVAYGSDLSKTKALLMDMLKKHKMILKNPEPIVIATNFGDSSVDFVIKFWVSHFNFGLDVKSDLILSIDRIFKKNNIVIPFPQRDIHIQSEVQITKEKDKSE